MSSTRTFTIGSEVRCDEQVCGELRRVVVDPVKRVLTHLVVEPGHGGMGRLVPVDLVDPTTDEITLRCTSSDFEALEEAEETQFLSGASGQWDYGQDQMLSWPYYGLGMGGMGGLGMGSGPTSFTQDKVPPGEVDIRRGEHVQATDGQIGRVQGLVIEPENHRVTHILLDHGHLWGQHRVAIPMSAVIDVGLDDGVRLTLSKDEIRDLPPVDLDHTD